jgi:glutaredoxin
MALRWKLVVLAFLIATPLAHAGKLYKWVDKDGNVSYHDQPPSSDGYRVEEKDLGDRRAAIGDAAEKAPVVLYSAAKCASCDTARAYLKTRGVPFTEKNVEGDRKLQDELIKQTGGLAVPTIMVGTKVMRGYLESLLEGELDQAGYPKAQSQETEKPAS